MHCDIFYVTFCLLNAVQFQKENVAYALTEPDTAPDTKVMVNVGSLVLYRSHSQLFPFS